ncbi:hypothetical protein EDB83DRAFT_2391533 [Lactarius deliciosus]|nr:hypothetical protein EDB83DRAFT_2391533 [Lactarius deliciosus]
MTFALVVSMFTISLFTLKLEGTTNNEHRSPAGRISSLTLRVRTSKCKLFFPIYSVVVTSRIMCCVYFRVFKATPFLYLTIPMGD